MRTYSFCTVPIPRTVYAGPSTKEEFDRLPLPETVHDWQHSETTTLLKKDGQQWERRCHSKVLGDYSRPGQVVVIFQWFDERVVEAPA